MPLLRIFSASEQVANYLREEIRSRRLQGGMPGSRRLAKELNIGKNTIDPALAILEEEGYLVSQGPARRRLIRIPEGAKTSTANPLRVAVMLYDPEDREWAFSLKLQSRLQKAGWQVQYAPKTLKELSMEPERIAKSIEAIEADAWIVFAASREVLEWFAKRSTPVMACFGRSEKLAIAQTGVITSEARVELVRKLHALGHRRIVMLSERVRRDPKPGVPEQSVLDEMKRLGIKTGPYNLPDWDDTPEGLRDCLDSLFEVTPPQALIIATPNLFLCTYNYLRNKGISAPKDVSLTCVEYAPMFKWLQPEPARIEFDSDKVVHQIFRWLRSVERGKPTKVKAHVKARLTEGGTIGTAMTT
jgi:DNA-binding LacI/PurR family transcriptional regulator